MVAVLQRLRKRRHYHNIPGKIVNPKNMFVYANKGLRVRILLVFLCIMHKVFLARLDERPAHPNERAKKQGARASRA